MTLCYIIIFCCRYNEQGRFIFLFAEIQAPESRMCTLCHGIQMRVAFEPDPLWTSVPRCSLPTIHLLEWVPDTHWGGSGDRCHAISHRKHTQSFTQRPHSYRWPITSVLGCWWRLGSPLPCGDKQVGIFHTGRNRKREGESHRTSVPVWSFRFKKEIGAMWRTVAARSEPWCLWVYFEEVRLPGFLFCWENKPALKHNCT